MHTFPDVRTYLSALTADPALAVIGTGMAAKALNLKRGAIEQRIARGSLEAVRIGSSVHVIAKSVATVLDRYEKLVSTIDAKLRGLAKKRGTITYKPLMQSIGLDHRLSNERKRIGEVLGEVSRRSFKEKKVMLSVLVIDKVRGLPSTGFYSLYEELFEEAIEDERAVFEDQRDKVFRAYT